MHAAPPQVRHEALLERAACLHIQVALDRFMGPLHLLNPVVVELLFALLLGAVVIATYPDTPWKLLQWGAIVLILGGAVICYPFAVSLWLAADLILRPLTDQELAWHREGGTADRELPHL